MYNLTAIYSFAEQWYRKLSISKVSLVGTLSFGEECTSLNFNMDAGQAFIQKYPEAFTEFEKLSRIINTINDIELIGSAIYTKWNHYIDSHCTSISPAEKLWFICLFKRLMELAKSHLSISAGHITKIQLRSYFTHHLYGTEKIVEIKQYLELSSNGRIKFTEYYKDALEPNVYSSIYKKCYYPTFSKIREERYTLSDTAIENLIHTLITYCLQPPVDMVPAQEGYWRIIVNTKAKTTFNFIGSIHDNICIADVNLSQLLRHYLPIDNLYGFEPVAPLIPISKVTITYSAKNNAENTHQVLSTYEELVINSELDTIELLQIYNNGTKISHRYELPRECSYLLNNLIIIDTTIIRPQIKHGSLSYFGIYKILIEYQDDTPAKSYALSDTTFFPPEYTLLFKELCRIFFSYNNSMLIDAVIIHPSTSKVQILCSVMLKRGSKPYYYLSNDYSLEIGDRVIVPVGNDSQELTGTIVNIQYVKIKDLPLPFEKLKFIKARIMTY